MALHALSCKAGVAPCCTTIMQYMVIHAHSVSIWPLYGLLQTKGTQSCKHCSLAHLGGKCTLQAQLRASWLAALVAQFWHLTGTCELLPLLLGKRLHDQRYCLTGRDSRYVRVGKLNLGDLTDRTSVQQLPDRHRKACMLNCIP